MPQPIIWYDFAPHGSGSFGRDDMGSFCKIGSQLFVVPVFEVSASTIPHAELDAKVRNLVDGTSHVVYELYNGEFTTDATVDWRNKIQSSIITEHRVH